MSGGVLPIATGSVVKAVPSPFPSLGVTSTVIRSPFFSPSVLNCGAVAPGAGTLFKPLVPVRDRIAVHVLALDFDAKLHFDHGLGREDTRGTDGGRMVAGGRPARRCGHPACCRDRRLGFRFPLTAPEGENNEEGRRERGAPPDSLQH